MLLLATDDRGEIRGKPPRRGQVNTKKSNKGGGGGRIVGFTETRGRAIEKLGTEEEDIR